MFWIIIGSFSLLMILAIVIYMMPAEAPKKKKEKETARRMELMPDPMAAAKQKDWEAIAYRWEKQNNALLGDIEKMKGDHKKNLQEIDAQKAELKELMDKLSLEKSWREKEQVTIEKFKAHEKEFKDQIYRTEGDLEKEHSWRIRLERDLQDLKIKHDEIVEEKRQLAVKSTSLETTLAQVSKELREIKRENVELGKKREDIQWVAKSEHDELRKVLADKEQEIARLRQQHA